MRYFIIYIITCAMVVSFSAGVWSEDMQQPIQAGSTEAGEVEDAGNAFCPVTGEKVDKNISDVYKGKRYYFCSPFCIKQFRSNPQKYIARLKDINLEAFQFGFSPERIIVKQGDVVRIFATSRDVTHGVYIKEYGINARVEKGKTAIIEFVADKPGEFDILCSVYCGPGHSRMEAKLIVEKGSGI